MAERKPNQPVPAVKEQQGFYDVPERYEIIDGVRYDFLSSPKITHQAIVGQLYSFLKLSCSANGVILIAPMDVHLSEDNIVQPDLIYITNDNMNIIRNEKIMGAPDLLVEILSPNTGSRDKVKKKELYARYSIPEYWIVDPVHRTVDQFLLTEGRTEYTLAATYDDQGLLLSDRFPCIAVKLDELFGELARFKQSDE